MKLPVIALCLSLVAGSFLSGSYGNNVNFCMDRTGLGANDVLKVDSRNLNCTVDCIMKQGVVQSFFQDEGTPCHSKENYKCILGNCRDPEAQKLATFNDLYSLEISILSAFVPDTDSVPGTGESDVFVTVEAANDAFPTYKPGDIICYTYVIQDNSKPRWNFKCKPRPMTADTKLRFRLFDSDKPFSLNPDKLGVATESVSTLMAKGTTKLMLNWPHNSQTPYHLMVEVKGRKHGAEE